MAKYFTMNSKKYTLFLLLFTAVICLFLLFYFLNRDQAENKIVSCAQDAKLCSDGSYVSRTAPNCEFQMCPKEDLIVVASPNAGEEIASPLFISGKARGYWFFEASFPIELVDENNNLISQTVAQAEGEWMTEDFVPFTATLNFSNPNTAQGFLIFKKDNPSGLPEYDDELKVPVVFKNN
jgi:hypothetical protein